MKTLVCVLFLFSLSLNTTAQAKLSFAQIVAASDEAQTTNVQLNWVLAGDLAEALFPPDNTTPTVNLNDDDAAITLTLLGNPTAHSVQLQSPEYQQLRYQLHDLQGRLLLSENDLPDATTRIDLSQLPAQIYILSVYTEQRAYPIKNFKIIKQ